MRTVWYNYFVFGYLDGQNCINNPGINRAGNTSIANDQQVIFPSISFNCNGRITGVAASMYPPSIFKLPNGKNLPVFQVWHPQSPGSNVYSVIGQVQFQPGTLQFNRRFINSVVSLTGDNQIQFQAGDVIGYYQPSNPLRLVWSIFSDNHTYYLSRSSDLSTVNISSADYKTIGLQPLISIMIGKFVLSYITIL